MNIITGLSVDTVQIYYVRLIAMIVENCVG